MNSKRAIWIFDDNFKELTFLSIRSFTTSVNWPVTLVYCGQNIAEISNQFDQYIPNIDWVVYNPDVSHFPLHLQATIVNRLGRMHICSKYSSDLIMLVDSDIVFNPCIGNEILMIEKEIDKYKKSDPIVFGVREYDSASDAYLLFNRKNTKGDAIKLSTSEKENILLRVFGDEWETLLSQSQFNNGLLFFYNSDGIIKEWNKFYLKILLEEKINPADDQVPLAAAINKMDAQIKNLPAKWNSLGRSSGNYIAFHAWAGNWKNDIKDIIYEVKELSDFGMICNRFCPELPGHWLDSLSRRLESTPSYYQRIPGYFDFGGIYSDIIKQVDKGHFVEVGTYKGRSACFMGELLKATRKEIKFDTVDHFFRKDTSLKQVLKEFNKAQVSRYIKIVNLHSREAVHNYSNNSLDFVFLDIEQNSHEFTYELENWYSKLKFGGLLAGYDYSIHDTVNYGYLCYSQEFAKNYNLPLRTYKQRFFITKPHQYAYDPV